MRAKISVSPIGNFAKILDFLMTPLMYLISGTFKEIPQRGHRWNNERLSRSDVELLDKSIMVHCEGIPSSMRSRWFFLFHIPIMGGWRNYVVLKPATGCLCWHIGYITSDMVGVSQVKLSNIVRMLIGPDEVFFYGIDAVTNEQIPIKEIGRGYIGKSGPFSRELLL